MWNFITAFFQELRETVNWKCVNTHYSTQGVFYGILLNVTANFIYIFYIYICIYTHKKYP